MIIIIHKVIFVILSIGRNTVKPIYVTLGFLFLALGVIGVVVPLLPTTPFLLLATFCFMRGSERLHQWFSNTSLYHKHLESFVQTRSLKLSTKIISLGLASAMLITGFMFTPTIWGKTLIAMVILFKYYFFYIPNRNTER
ncbi:YbaN family protein [Paenibacillus brasilensis]|nr:YbaN family protein [Paenibacillus brasilensis]